MIFLLTQQKHNKVNLNMNIPDGDMVCMLRQNKAEVDHKLDTWHPSSSWRRQLLYHVYKLISGMRGSFIWKKALVRRAQTENEAPHGVLLKRTEQLLCSCTLSLRTSLIHFRDSVHSNHEWFSESIDLNNHSNGSHKSLCARCRFLLAAK